MNRDDLNKAFGTIKTNGWVGTYDLSPPHTQQMAIQVAGLLYVKIGGATEDQADHDD